MSDNYLECYGFFGNRPNCKLNVNSKIVPTFSSQWGGLNSKFNLDNKTYIEFWNWYSSIYRKENTGLQQPLSGEIPLVFDIDLKLPYDDYKSAYMNNNQIEPNYISGFRQYYNTNRFSKFLSIIYISLLNNLKDNNVHKDNFKCILLEKNSREDNGYVKNGFHIHFPFLFIRKEKIKSVIIPDIINRVKKYDNERDNSGEYIFGELFGSIDKIIDSNHLNNWFIYGGKKRGLAAYKVRLNKQNIFFDMCKIIDKLDECDGKNIFNYNDRKYKVKSVEGEIFFKDLNYRYKSLDKDGKICTVSMDFFKDNKLCLERVQYFLPRLFDMTGGGRSSGNCEKYLREVKETFKCNNKKSSNDLKLNNSKGPALDIDIDYLRQLVFCCDIKRAVDYESYRDMGFCIHNCTNGSIEGWNIFNEFGEQSVNHQSHSDMMERLQFWKSIRDDVNLKPLTAGSLHYWAKIDDLERFNQIRSSKNKSHLKTFIKNASHLYGSKLLYNISPYEFACYDCRKGGRGWFKFDQKEHIWKEDPAARSVLLEFETIISMLLEQKNIDLKTKDKFDKLPDEKTCKKIEDRYNYLINLAGNEPFRKSVISLSAKHYYSEVFNDNLNMNPKLIAFKNGVFDMEKLKFRDGNPSDYLSAKLPIKFYNNIEDIKEDCNLAYDYLDKIFTNKDLLNYFLDYMAYIFEGGNHKNIAMFWTGIGSNGKSKTQEIIKTMLGYFHKDVSTTLITSKKCGASQARPELARCGGGVRLISMQEPGYNENINTGTLKSLTGNDEYYARDLYKAGSETKDTTPLFKFLMTANRLPDIVNADPATARRIRVIEFTSKFKDRLICDTCSRKFRIAGLKKLPKNCPCIRCKKDQIKHKIFLKDHNLSNRKYIYRIAQALGNILAHRYIALEKFRITNTDNRIDERNYKENEMLEPVHLPKCVQQASDRYYNLNDNYQNFTDQRIIRDENKDINVDELINRFKEYLKDECPNNTITISKTEMKRKFEDILGYIRYGKIMGYRFKSNIEITNNDNTILGPSYDDDIDDTDDTDEL